MSSEIPFFLSPPPHCHPPRLLRKLQHDAVLQSVDSPPPSLPCRRDVWGLLRRNTDNRQVNEHSRDFANSENEDWMREGTAEPRELVGQEKSSLRSEVT